MTAPVRLCKDCRHARRDLWSIVLSPLDAWRFATCAAAPATLDTYEYRVATMVTGRPGPGAKQEACSVARITPCGPDGKLFEARP